MNVTKVTIEFDTGLRLEVEPTSNRLGGLTLSDADFLATISTPDSLAERFKSLADQAIEFLKTRRWR